MKRKTKKLKTFKFDKPTNHITAYFQARNRASFYQVSDPETVLTMEEVNHVVGFYKQKMVERLEGFCHEAKRMDKKVHQVFDALEEKGVIVNSVRMSEDTFNTINKAKGIKAKKSKLLTFDLAATRGPIKLEGSMVLSPASLKLALVEKDRPYGYPVYRAVFYKNLVLKDNLLPTLVKKPSNSEIDF